MQATPTSFWEWAAGPYSEERIWLLFICLTAMVMIIVTAAVTIYSMHRNRLDDSLKRELLDRGIERRRDRDRDEQIARQARVAEIDKPLKGQGETKHERIVIG